MQASSPQCSSASHSLTHTHVYSTQHTERAAGGFIREMVLILLSAFTNRHPAPWNIRFASCQSCFSHIGRMKLEIMWDLRLFSKQRREGLFKFFYFLLYRQTLYMLGMNYCICKCEWLSGKMWCDTWWHICAPCAWKIKLPSFWCSLHVCALHVCLLRVCESAHVCVFVCVLLLSIAPQTACILMFRRSDNRISQDIYSVKF